MLKLAKVILLTPYPLFCCSFIVYIWGGIIFTLLVGGDVSFTVFDTLFSWVIALVSLLGILGTWGLIRGYRGKRDIITLWLLVAGLIPSLIVMWKDLSGMFATVKYQDIVDFLIYIFLVGPIGFSIKWIAECANQALKQGRAK